MTAGLNIFLESLEVIPEVEQQPEPSKEELQGDWEHDDDEVLDEDQGLVVPDQEKSSPGMMPTKTDFHRGRMH